MLASNRCRSLARLLSRAVLLEMPLLLALGESSNIEVDSPNQNAAVVVSVAPLTGPGLSTMTYQNIVSTPTTTSWAVPSSSMPSFADGQSSSVPSSQPLTTVTGILWENVTSTSFVTQGSDLPTSTSSTVASALPSGPISLATSAIADSFRPSKTTTTLTTRFRTTLYVTSVTTAPRLNTTLANPMWSDWTNGAPSPSKSWPAWMNSTASRIIPNMFSSGPPSATSTVKGESLPVATVTVYATSPLLTDSPTTTVTVTVLATSTETRLNSLTSGSSMVSTAGATNLSPHTSTTSVASVHTPSSAVNATTSSNVGPSLSLQLPSGVFLSTETNGVVYSYSGYVSANTTHYVSALGPVTTTCVPTTIVTYYDARGNATRTVPQCGPGIGPAVTPASGSTDLDTPIPQATPSSTASLPTTNPLPTAPAASLSGANPAPPPLSARPSGSPACSLIFGTSAPQGCTLTPAITSHASGVASAMPRLWRDGGVDSAAYTIVTKRDRAQTRVATTFPSTGFAGGQPTTLITLPRSRSPPPHA
ncbi:uncharacterized protein PV07_01273 [Cladophialophora immunda]|uniref:Ig-like domain-containing protein n=1 Tax=Cladophialophora immunda TaxID=569365 RepID=A0A0D2BAC8_9EURO|nr:uncharacterized protein PV07_01273 [Cladophialophora immunda]KIW34497.1 hypothetical protein PV07_01273 [Cladophialophora immunda]OQV05550.1 hypothetical protein CLAIMM_10277 [Cladophialophora immunda]